MIAKVRPFWNFSCMRLFCTLYFLWSWILLFFLLSFFSNKLIFQAEFMEHDEKALPIDIRLLGALAEKVTSDFVFLFSVLIKKNPISCFYALVSYAFDFFTTLQCRAFAKALHYKEMEFEGARSKKMDANPVAVVEALIHINNQLHQHEVS